MLSPHVSADLMEEADVGVTEYVQAGTQGFSAILKHRCGVGPGVGGRYGWTSTEVEGGSEPRDRGL